jgi:biotin synthase
MPDAPRHDWTAAEVRAIHDSPLLDLAYRAATVHRENHDPEQVQVCRLISVKTGGCPEDCSYCSQSARYRTPVDAEPMLDVGAVVETARKAKAAGATRVCLGAAWREVKDDARFERVLEMVRQVSGLGVEVCCTLGMLTPEQARRLEEAGLYAYNHNLDTSREYYPEIISTRSYDDRLRTIGHVRTTAVTVCSGGILGMGESVDDRVGMLVELARLDPHPESVPVNVLSKVPGTPLAHAGEVRFDEVLRVIATARIVLPRSVVRLSTGRSKMSASEQALCFLAGANSVFSSDERKMLTIAAASPDYDADRELLTALGLRMRPPFAEAGKS